MKIALAGTRSFGRAVLNHLLATDHETAIVAAPLDDTLRAHAANHRIPTVDRLVRDNIPDGTDLIIAAHSHDFISRAARQRTTHGAIGYHPSLLPLHRGRDAVRWTIRDRDRVTGGSVYWLDDGIDAGPLAAQRLVFVRPGWDASDLWREALFPLGVELLAAAIDDIANGRIVKAPQDHALATWEPSMDTPRLYRPDLPELPAPGGQRQEWVTTLA